jgi:hypothetical protein
MTSAEGSVLSGLVVAKHREGRRIVVYTGLCGSGKTRRILQCTKGVGAQRFISLNEKVRDSNLMSTLRPLQLVDTVDLIIHVSPFADMYDVSRAFFEMFVVCCVRSRGGETIRCGRDCLWKYHIEMPSALSCKVADRRVEKDLSVERSIIVQKRLIDDGFPGFAALFGKPDELRSGVAFDCTSGNFNRAFQVASGFTKNRLSTPGVEFSFPSHGECEKILNELIDIADRPRRSSARSSVCRSFSHICRRSANSSRRRKTGSSSFPQ